MQTPEETHAVLTKVLEQYRSGLMTTDEAILEIADIVFKIEERSEPGGGRQN